MNKEAIKLLDRLYKDLYLSDEVLHHSSGNKYDKFNNIKEYIDKLEDIHTRVSETGRHISYLKTLYYDKYVIKAEDIPESYYEHQNEIALERGYGHVIVDIEQIQEEVINNQKARLDVWLDYFLSEDAKVYPFWAKYWAFQGMLKLGTYDKEKGEFHKRTKNTVEPFADLNREALAMSIDMMVKMLNKEEIDDKELEILVKTGSFQKIYSYILTKVLKDNKNIAKRNTGKWIKYDRGSDHMPLVESLKGYNTGWCTAGELTAKSQLQGGDFYVYYTLDENGEYKIPRIAIRMEYEQIVEIRGIDKNQNIESDMLDTVEEKLKEFPDKEQYYKKVSDMKKLTSIYKKHQNKEELTKEDLRFLYEIEGKIIGFGYYGIDPRKFEIIKQRNSIKKDVSFALDCSETQVAIQNSQLNSNTMYYHGNLNFHWFENAKSIKLPKFINGSLDLCYLINSAGLTLPQTIVGALNLKSLQNVEKLVFPRSIGLYLDLSSLKRYEELILPDSVGGVLDLGNLIIAKNLVLPKYVGGHLILRNLENAEELILPEIVGETLILSNLKEIKKLKLPKVVGKGVKLSSLTSIDGLIIPEPLTYKIVMNGFYITPENVHLYRNNKTK